MNWNPVDKLIQAVKKAKSSIGSTISRLFSRDKPVRADADKAGKEVTAALNELNKTASDWNKTHLTNAAKEGTSYAIKMLRDTQKQLDLGDVKLNKATRDMLAVAIQQTNADVLAVTQNMDRRAKIVIRNTLAESLRANLGSNINKASAIKADILTRLKQVSDPLLNTGIIDAAGRRWKPEDYVDMLVKTKLAQVQREATVLEALDRGAMYARISSHGAKDACSRWEGRIVKLVPDAPGDYPYYADLSTREIFHPRCRHVLMPMRSPED